MTYPTVALKLQAEELIRTGYPRVFQKQIASKKGKISPGDIVDVLDSRGAFVARGTANPYSRILVRILSYDPDESIDNDFFYGRLRAAKELRDRYAVETSYRAVFSESDRLPGLIVDRFDAYLVCQIGMMGMEVRREAIFSMLQELYAPKGIFEKSSATMRKPEHLTPRVQLIAGDCPALIPFEQNDLIFLNDVMHGQKTGFFLDQRDNREAVSRYVRKEDHVLDGFSYTGGFSLIAAKAGARVTAFDISERPLRIAQEAAARNALQDRCNFQQVDAFAKLRELEEAQAQFDMVILDPPAFAKHRGVLPNALRGYRIINRRAMNLLPEGGILVSCSCTQQVSEGMFLEMLNQAADDVKRELRLLEVRRQPFDHPVLASLPETRYLKCVIGQII